MLTARQREHLRLQEAFPVADDGRPCTAYPKEECTDGRRINRCKWDPIGKACTSSKPFAETAVGGLPFPDMRHRDTLSTPAYKRKTSWKRAKLDRMPSPPKRMPSSPKRPRSLPTTPLDGRTGACREGLYAAPTTLTDARGAPLPFLGLHTALAIPKGGFVGFYTGTFRYVGDAERAVSSRSAYAMFTGLHVITPPGGAKRLKAATYPLALVNEPGPGTAANLVKRVYSRGADVGVACRDVDALAFHACRDVAAGEELFLHYGDVYDRELYEHDAQGRPRVGAPCTALRVADIPRDELPRAHVASWPKARGVALME